MLQITSGAEPTMDSKHLQPTCEDYFSDDGQSHGVAIESFSPDPSPGKANVRTKRSDPDGMGVDKTPTGGVPNSFDLKSDSGYSSQSVAGMSSADSAASATSQRSPPFVPLNPVPAAPSPPPTQRPRPPPQRQQSTQSTQSAQSAPRQPLQRRESQASRRPTSERRPTISQAPPKRRDSRNVDDCTVPGCTNCGPDAVDPRRRQSRRQSMLQQQPAESAPDVSYPRPYTDTRSQVSDPAPYQPASPTNSRQPPLYHAQGGPVIQPGVSRRPSVSGRPARPTSYHGDPRDGYGWPPSGMHSTRSSPPQEHGPPPSRSAAYSNMPYPPQQSVPGYMAQQFTAPPNPYFAQVQQMQPAYEQRPPLLPRSSHTSAYGPVSSAVVQVEHSGPRPMPSARYHSSTALPQVPPQRRPLPIDYRNEHDEEDSETGSETESDSGAEYEEHHPRPIRKIMGPPEPRPQKAASKRRPNLLHANTTPAPLALEPRRPQAVVVPDRRAPRDRDREARSSRRTSVSRPPPVPSIKSHSAYDTPQARVFVEGSRTSRRQSQLVHDRSNEHRIVRQQEYNQEQRRQKRSSRMYDDDLIVGQDFERQTYDDDEEDEPMARAPLRRRDTDVESRRRSQRPAEVKKKADAAEDYMNAKRGDRETYADQTYEVAKKRSSRVSGGPSEAESSRSKGSDNGNGEIRLRIGNDAPVTLSLNGDMEGRTLQLVPIENGMNELVISGNAHGVETTYVSERGSVRNERRAIMPASQARRDAEEMTEKSSHSSRRRRETRGEQDEPRRVLGRRPRNEGRREVEYRY